MEFRRERSGGGLAPFEHHGGAVGDVLIEERGETPGQLEAFTGVAGTGAAGLDILQEGGEVAGEVAVEQEIKNAPAGAFDGEGVLFGIGAAGLLGGGDAVEPVVDEEVERGEVAVGQHVRRGAPGHVEEKVVLEPRLLNTVGDNNTIAFGEDFRRPNAALAQTAKEIIRHPLQAAAPRDIQLHINEPFPPCHVPS